MNGPPISYTELKARSDLLGEWLEPWEVLAIRRMDTVFRDAVQEIEGRK